MGIFDRIRANLPSPLASSAGGGGGSGANTSLSNISATTVSADLKFQNIDNGTYPPQLWTVGTADATGSNANDLTIRTGGATGGGTHGGTLRFVTGDAPHPHGMFFTTATASPFVGGDPGGPISFTTGNGPGGRGTIYLKNGSEGTVGHVWTSTGTGGEGAWQAASGGGGTKTGASVGGTNTAVNSSTWAQISFASTTYDYGSVVSGNTFVAPSAGLYIITVYGGISGFGASDYFNFGGSINSGSIQFAISQANGSASGTTTQSNGSYIADLAAGGVFRFFALASNTFTLQNITLSIAKLS